MPVTLPLHIFVACFHHFETRTTNISKQLGHDPVRSTSALAEFASSLWQNKGSPFQFQKFFLFEKKNAIHRNKYVETRVS